jgi:peptidyl-prolyl cis-trans isomerase D
MQIIQNIRDKGTAIVITVIALSLIGFLLMDANTGSNNAGASRSTVIGSVNGEDIDGEEFNKRVASAVKLPDLNLTGFVRVSGTR